MYKIGIDVGGTNTDAVIMDENSNLIKGVKTTTTPDIETGIKTALHNVIQESMINPQDVNYAMLGTTQCTNAIVERKKLDKVGVIRLGYPATASIPPLTGWPEDLAGKIGNTYEILSGGYEYNGRIISNFDEERVRKTLENWKDSIDSLAVVGVFSSVNNDQELVVEKIAKEIYGESFPVSCSSNVGSVGFLDRENSTILNAALQSVMKATTSGFLQAQKDEGIHDANIYFCQNDGTLMSVTYAKNFPILTIACGPTNSIRGAAYLAGKDNAITLDVGGTTADLGVLTNGFPRESSMAVTVGGVRTNFRMPDILSIGLGGGTIVHIENDDVVAVGPDSVGHNLTKEAKVFGGDTMTTTDISVRLGRSEVGDPSLVEDIPLELAQKADTIIKEQLEVAIDSMKTSEQDVEIILVGGGSIIVPGQLNGVSKIIKDENGDVANAIGSSISQISGEFEQLYVYAETPREKCITDATSKARSHAKEAGAIAETIETAEIEETPLAYTEGNTNRVRVKVIGNMK